MDNNIKNKIKSIYSSQYCGNKTNPLYYENVFVIIHSFNTINNSQGFEIACQYNHENMFEHFKDLVRVTKDMLLRMCEIGKLKGARHIFLKAILLKEFCKKELISECLEAACKHGQLEIIKYYWNYEFSNEIMNSLFITMCENGHVDCVKYILNDDDVNCEEYGYLLLSSVRKGIEIARENKHEEVVKLLSSQI